MARLFPLPALVVASVCALVACGESPPPPWRPQGPPPSILLVSLDTLRADHVGFMGYERDTTPYLDRLARESLVYASAYSTASWTLISHMSLLTGLYPSQHGVFEEEHALSPDVPLLAERLAEQGYQTLGFYFEGWIHERHGFGRGFDVFRSHRDAEEAEAHLAEALAELDPERPVFLFVHLFDIHSVPLTEPDTLFYAPPPPHDAVFVEDAVQRLEGVNFREVRAGRASLTPEQVEALVALYDGGVRYLDTKLEGWVEDWRASGLLDRSLLVVTSDHGDALAQRAKGIRGHGGMFEDGIHVPLLMRFPDGYRAGDVESAQVSQVDLVPSLLGALGLAPEAWLPGVSLFEAPPGPRVLLAERPPLRTLLRHPHKYTGDPGGGGKVYHLEADPEELYGFGREHVLAAPVVAELEAALAAQEAARPGLQVESETPEALDPELLEELRALGYVGEN